MNEQTQQMLNELCEKLGVAAEHLWGVLIKQAYLSGVTDLLVYVVWAVLLVWFFRLVHRKTKHGGKPDGAEWEDEGAALAWGLWGFLAVILFLIISFSIGNSISAILNPEYWALKQILP